MNRLLLKEIRYCIHCIFANDDDVAHGYFCTLSKKKIPDRSGYSIPEWCKLEKMSKSP